MTRLGYVDRIITVLQRRPERVALQIIDDVEPEPSVGTVDRGAELMRSFQPDTIVALGGGSAMDAAKVMWLRYEHPEVVFADMREKFFDVRKRAVKFPVLGERAQLVRIPTTSGTGAEVTPFAVITDTTTGKKYPLADYALTPSVAIVDPVLAADLPRTVTADSGFDALTHATESYVSVYANDFTDGLALQAIKMIFGHLERAVTNGAADPEAREKMHNAGTIAGMAFGSAFLGIVHAMSHTLGATFHVAHGSRTSRGCSVCRPPHRRRVWSRTPGRWSNSAMRWASRRRSSRSVWTSRRSWTHSNSRASTLTRTSAPRRTRGCRCSATCSS